MKEKAFDSSRKDSEGREPAVGLRESFRDEGFSILGFLVVLSSLSTMLLGNSFGGSTSNAFSLRRTSAGLISLG